MANDIWEKVDNEVEEMDSSKSALFRQIIESHYSVNPHQDITDYEEFKAIVFSTQASDMVFHICKHGLVILSQV